MEILYVECPLGFRILFMVMCSAIVMLSWAILACLCLTEANSITNLARILMFFALITCAFMTYPLSETGIKEKIYVRFTEPIMNIEEFYEHYEIIDKKGEDIYVLISKD